jgi:ABC-type transport system involved in cytochrome c biogenesis permease component
MLISLPALPVIMAGVLILDDLFTMDLHDGTVDQSDVVLLRHGGD